MSAYLLFLFEGGNLTGFGAFCCNSVKGTVWMIRRGKIKEDECQKKKNSHKRIDSIQRQEVERLSYHPFMKVKALKLRKPHLKKVNFGFK